MSLGADFRFSAFADEIDANFDVQLSSLKRLGISLLELRGVDGKSFVQLSADEISVVRQKLKSASIGLSALGSPIGKMDADGDFASHKQLFSHIMDVGETLGCNRIRMFSFYPGKLSQKEFQGRAYEWMDELLFMAERRGFELCHENEKDILGESPESELELLTHFHGRLKAVLDLGNFAFCKLDASKAYPLLKSYISYLHIKDADEEGTIVPPGLGKAHLEDTIQAISHDRPGQTVIMTMEPHLMVFAGLSNLSKLDDIHHKYSFESPFEAFQTAYHSTLEMALKAGRVI